MYEIREAREETTEVLRQLCAAIRTVDDTVPTRYLERLTADRDRKIAFAYASLDMTVFQIATITGLSWTAVYDIADRVREQERRRGPFAALGLVDPPVQAPSLDIPDTPPKPDVEDDR